MWYIDYIASLNAYGSCAQDVTFDKCKRFDARLGSSLDAFAKSIGTNSQFLTGALLPEWSSGVGVNALYEVPLVNR